MRAVILLWFCFVARGVFYSVLFPLWEGYDEYAHFGFIQHLVTHGTLPFTSTPLSKEIEVSLRLAPIPWTTRNIIPGGTTHDAYWKLPESVRAQREEALRKLTPGSAGESADPGIANWEAQQPPLYYWLLSLPLRLTSSWPLGSRILLLRILSLTIASIAVPATWYIAAQIFRNPGHALGVTAIFCAMPELMINLSRIGNESIPVVLFCLLLAGFFRFAEHPDWKSAGFTGVVIGLGLLSKAYFLVALPVLGCLLLGCILSRPAARRDCLKWGAVALAIALCLSGWWYWRNHVLTGSWSGIMTDVALRKMSVADLVRAVPGVDWRSAFVSVLISHIWMGNWSFLQVRSWIYHAFLCVVPLSAGGLGWIAYSSVCGRRRQIPFLASAGNLAITGALYAVFWLALLYHALTTALAMGIASSQGWYLYGLGAAEAILVVAGIMTVIPRSSWVIPAAVAAFALLDLYTVHFLLIPYYTGLIAHNPAGALASFHLSQLATTTTRVIFERLAINKPLGAAGTSAIWAVYAAVTLALPFLAARQISLHRAEERD
jgi:hypothetical protein